MGKKLLRTALPALFWLGVWALAAAAVDRELLLPAPWAVAAALGQLVQRADFWRSVLLSLVRVMAGFLAGSLLGALLGVATAAWGWCDRLLSPALRAVRTVPVVSFILLLFFWLPKDRVPGAVAALMALPVVWRAARQGISSADPRLLELADHYGLGRGSKAKLVYFPAAMPALAAGLETALGLCWKSGIAAEVLCQPKWAAGTMLQISKAYLDAPGLFAWTAVVVALSMGLERPLKALLKPWRGGGEA